MADRFEPTPLQTQDGEPWSEAGTDTHATIEAGTYQGPEARANYPWKCPSCGAENVGVLEEGCAVCGSGSSRPYKVEVAAPPPAPRRAESPAFQAVKADLARGLEVQEAALAWIAANPRASLVDAFVAGYQTAKAEAMRTATAAAATAADASPTGETYSPEGRKPRTIVAALEYFRDQILPTAGEEIAIGMWSSIEEVDQMIAAFKERT